MISPSSLMPGDVILSYVDVINDELHVFSPKLVVSVRPPEVTMLTNVGISCTRTSTSTTRMSWSLIKDGEDDV